MRKSKASPNWIISPIYLVCNLSIILAVKLLLIQGFKSVDVDFLFDFLNVADNIFLIPLFFIITFDVLPVWMGTVLSAQILRKKWILEDKNRIIKISTVCLAVFLGFLVISLFLNLHLLTKLSNLFFLPLLPLAMILKALPVPIFGIFSIFISISIITLLFYTFSKKYLCNLKTLDAVKSIRFIPKSIILIIFIFSVLPFILKLIQKVMGIV